MFTAIYYRKNLKRFMYEVTSVVTNTSTERVGWYSNYGNALQAAGLPVRGEYPTHIDLTMLPRRRMRDTP